MREQFEQRDADGLGRLGELTVPRAGVTVETPALMPVVNPNILTVEPSRLGDEFGAEILITNSYIIRRDEDLRERARSEGLHAMLDFDGAIVTDSGSFQLAEYGEIDVTTAEIVRFQREIGSDVGTPVDVPTPPDVDRERAERDLAETETALADAEAIDVGDMLLNAPVQGSTFPDLRERAARHAYGTDLDVFPVGAVVPLMNAYRYADVVDVVLASKAGLGADAPVHLFGAGHPSMFALAVAAGCDLFDSAAYAIYARDGRYLTVRGTRQVEELTYLPCSCPVCATHDAAGLRDLPADERERRLAEHNLHVSFAELRRVKQAVREGSLFELVEARARGHPALLDGYRRLLEYADRLEAADPASKSTFFHLSTESARRPEVRRHHERVRRLDVRRVGGDAAAEADEDGRGAADADADDWRLLLTEGGFPTDGYDAVWRLVPPFGPFPRALSGTYPLTAQVPERVDDAATLAAARGVASLVDANPDVAVTVAHADWPDRALAALPESVAARRVQGAGDDGGAEADDDPGGD